MLKLLETSTRSSSSTLHKKDSEEVTKTPGKTSIMTTSTGRTLKRKHEDDATNLNEEASEDLIPEKK